MTLAPRFSVRKSVIAAFLGLAIFQAGCAPISAKAGFESKSIAQVQTVLHAKSAPALIDVREPDEFASGHVPGAVNVPLATVGDWALKQSKDKAVVVICRSGKRSLNASQVLLDQGFQSVTNVEGGTMAWIQKGLPVER